LRLIPFTIFQSQKCANGEICGYLFEFKTDTRFWRVHKAGGELSY
jgi:hypothetical protein